jgi:hypothetical protein
MLQSKRGAEASKRAVLVALLKIIFTKSTRPSSSISMTMLFDYYF